MKTKDYVGFNLYTVDGKSYSIDLYRGGYISSQGKNLYMAMFTNDTEFAPSGEAWRIQT